MENKQNNRFAAAAFDDSDDEVVVNVKQTKTQKKKEERKIETVVAKPVKFNANKMAEGGFEVINKDGKAAQAKTDVKPAGRGRGGNRGDRGGADKASKFENTRPRTDYKRESEGNEVKERKDRQPFRGKPREEGHPFDK